MATQGLVTIVRDGRVAMKFIAGSNGMEAGNLAAAIAGMGRVPDLVEGYELAVRCGFGSCESLVVMDARSVEFRGADDVPDLYRATFDQPEFNPRWEQGTAEYLKVIAL